MAETAFFLTASDISSEILFWGCGSAGDFSLTNYLKSPIVTKDLPDFESVYTGSPSNVFSALFSPWIFLIQFFCSLVSSNFLVSSVWVSANYFDFQSLL